jgi:putative membrane protein
MIRTGKIAMAAVVLMAMPAVAQAQDKGDQTFIRKAVQGNLAEVQLGQLAKQKASTDSVRSLGDMLVADHSANNQKAIPLAQSLQVTPPAAPNAEQKKTYDHLSGLSGDKFDREFVEHMVKDHKKEISEFRKETKSKNAQVAAYAGETLPDLQKHLQAAQAAEKSVKK